MVLETRGDLDGTRPAESVTPTICMQCAMILSSIVDGVLLSHLSALMSGVLIQFCTNVEHSWRAVRLIWPTLKYMGRRKQLVIYTQKPQYWYKSHQIHTLSLVVMPFYTLACVAIMSAMSTGALHAHHRAGEKALTGRAVVIHMFRSERFGAL